MNSALIILSRLYYKLFLETFDHLYKETHENMFYGCLVLVIKESWIYVLNQVYDSCAQVEILDILQFLFYP